MKLSQCFPSFPNSLKVMFAALIFIGCILLTSALTSLIYLVEIDSINTKLWLTQALGAIGSFALPAYWFCKLDSSNNIKQYLNLKKASSIFWICSILWIICIIPFINATMEWSKDLFSDSGAIPAWEAKLREMSERSKILTELLLINSNIYALICNIIVVAILPAICEELLFRGCFQRFLCRWTNKSHISIWIVAILFSLFHLDIYGFIPRMILGAGFGYLYYYSSSLYIPIILHFLNNLSVVIAYFLFSKGILNQNPEDFSGFNGWTLTILSFIISLSLVVFLRKKSKA